MIIIKLKLLLVVLGLLVPVLVIVLGLVLMREVGPIVPDTEQLQSNLVTVVVELAVTADSKLMRQGLQQLGKVMVQVQKIQM